MYGLVILIPDVQPLFDVLEQEPLEAIGEVQRQIGGLGEAELEPIFLLLHVLE